MAREAFTKKLYSVNDFSRLPQIYLSTIGVFSTIANDKITMKASFLFYISSLNLWLCVTGEIIFLFGSLARGQANFIQSTYLILCIGFILISIVKVVSLLMRMGEITKLFLDMNSLHPKTLAEQEEFHVRHFVHRTTTIVWWYAILMLFMIFCFSFFPLSTTISQYFHSKEWEIEFSYTIWYPVDPYKRGLFEIFYASQIYAALVSAISIVAVDTLLCCAVKLTCMHLEHLSEVIGKYKPEPKHTVNEKIFFLDFIKKHNTVLE